MEMCNLKENCGDHFIILVSSNCLQKQLLVAALNRVFRWSCICASNLDNILTPEKLPPHGSLIMLDCFGRNPRKIISSLKSEWKGYLQYHKVALFNLSTEDQIEIQAMALGVRGFFYEKDQLSILKKGILSILNWEIWASRQKLAECILEGSSVSPNFHVSNAASLAGLTAREEEILSLLAVGASNDDIAGTLFISTHTVRTHNSNIFKKIKVANRLEAVLWHNKHI
jgi:LuxR family transcriptional regulator of csgAB operon